ncbi:uncharacterized protein LOC123692067 isoform X2 [Colias croceus]|uniref:uncharacterized protein LOC123692067 isoform X2 n=1 Tax=Colias crocea TaxID=72248 RepID=UPI001E27F0E7|nr:uncharacterized protein LOC123692067 isoform X2 [Colias croceus]
MIFKSSIVLFCVFFAVGVLGGRKASSTKEAQGNDQDEYARENSYDQTQQIYNNQPQNTNDYGQSGQNDYYGQNTHRLPVYKPVIIGNGRQNTNVVAISGSDPSYIVGYTNQDEDYDLYNDKRGQQYPGSKGNSFIAVNQRPGEPETVILSSRSKHGHQSTIIVNQEGADQNPGPYKNLPNNKKHFIGKQNYNQNTRQSQEFGGIRY